MLTPGADGSHSLDCLESAKRYTLSWPRIGRLVQLVERATMIYNAGLASFAVERAPGWRLQR